MIRADINDGRIVVTADAEGALVAARLPGATRSAKMPPLTWHMPLTLDSAFALKGAQAAFSEALTLEARHMVRVQRFVDAQKDADTVEPIAPVPLKAGMSLYNHQIKAFNIALALMGYIN